MSRTKRAEMDMIHGSIWNKIPQFALPIAATAILGQLFNASDLAVVGNFTGEARNACVAAVSSNSAIVSLVVNFFVGIGLGANVVIANALGRDDRDMVEKTVHTAILLSVLGGILMAAFGEAIAHSLLSSLNVPEDVFDMALTYLRIYFLGMPVILLYNFEAAIFRSVGDTKTPLLALALSGVLNVLLNLFFVLVLKMTVDGVAIATVSANAVSAVILFLKLRNTDKSIKLDLSKLRIDGKALGRILRIGVPAGIQSALFSLSNILITSSVNSLGTVVMAASGASSNVEMFAYAVLNSFSQACTTFVGQNYGAGEIKRCRKVLALCLLECAICTACIVLLALTFGKNLLAVFNSDPEVVAIGYTRLKLIFFAYIFTTLYENMSGYLRGFGISLLPALLTAFGICGLRVVWVYTVFRANPTFQTVMTVYPVSLSTTAVLVGIALLICHPARRHLKAGAENLA